MENTITRANLDVLIDFIDLISRTNPEFIFSPILNQICFKFIRYKGDLDEIPS